MHYYDLAVHHSKDNEFFNEEFLFQEIMRDIHMYTNAYVICLYTSQRKKCPVLLMLQARYSFPKPHSCRTKTHMIHLDYLLFTRFYNITRLHNPLSCTYSERKQLSADHKISNKSGNKESDSDNLLAVIIIRQLHGGSIYWGIH